MKALFDACVPRSEVLSGELQEARFAARLADVVRGTADPVYGDPRVFFTRTHPTEGLRTLLKETLGRLDGTDPIAAPVIRLETGFGGGKTHSLIALYHAVSGKVSPELLVPYLGGDTPSPRAPVRVAAVVGDDLNPIEGTRYPDGVTTFTPWGEIAYQLGGPSAYEKVRANDESHVPGGIPWRDVLGEGPALILLDELAPYLRTLRTWKGKEVLSGILAPFLKGLLEAVAASPRAVCVLTLAEASDAFGDETEELGQALTQLISELKAISARVERLLTPTHGEEEIARILVRQLFEDVDCSAARETAEAYRSYLEEAQHQGAELPGTATTPDYASLLQSSYPFHPDLLVTLNRKVSTIPSFQRTRGVLRLLARVVRRLWDTSPSETWLIHPHHLDLSFAPIVEELTSRLDRPRYREVVHADIASAIQQEPGFASKVDAEWIAAGRRPFAVRAATAIFLHSLTGAGGGGARTEEVGLACLAPGDDPALFVKALKELERRCWYLEYDGDRWRFQTEPSLNKMIVDEMQYVGITRAKLVLEERLRGVWQSGVFDVRRFPAEPADIPDDAGKPKLAVLHFDGATAKDLDQRPPDLVRRLMTEKGTQGEPRSFQNNVIFLVCDEAQRDVVVDRAREAEAVRRLVDDPERQKALSVDQKRRLRERRDETDLQVRVAMHRAYRFLYYPSGDATKEGSYLSREAMPPQDQGEIRRDQSQVVLEVLRRLEKVYISDDPPIAPERVKQSTWVHGAREMPVGDVLRAFAVRRGLRMLLDPKPLREGIAQGVRRGLWVYYDPTEGKGYGVESPAPLVRLDGDAELMEPELARERSVPIVGTTAPTAMCPVCGNPADHCTCQPPLPPLPEEAIEASGTVDQALQGILDRMKDRGIVALAFMRVHVEGLDVEGVRALRSLGLAIPQLGPGQFRLELTAAAEYDGRDSLKVDFRGPWERYRELKDSLVSTLEKAPHSTLRASLEWRAVTYLTTEALVRARDVLRHLDLGRVRMVGEPAGDGGKPR